MNYRCCEEEKKNANEITIWECSNEKPVMSLKTFAGNVFLFYLILTLFVPLFLLSIRLCTYIQSNEFQEWWIMIIWVLVLPLTTLAIMFTRRGNKK